VRGYEHLGTFPLGDRRWHPSPPAVSGVVNNRTSSIDIKSSSCTPVLKVFRSVENKKLDLLSFGASHPVMPWPTEEHGGEDGVESGGFDIKQQSRTRRSGGRVLISITCSHVTPARTLRFGTEEQAE